jgi:hypothetical protein
MAAPAGSETVKAATIATASAPHLARVVLISGRFIARSLERPVTSWMQDISMME